MLVVLPACQGFLVEMATVEKTAEHPVAGTENKGGKKDESEQKNNASPGREIEPVGNEEARTGTDGSHKPAAPEKSGTGI